MNVCHRTVTQSKAIRLSARVRFIAALALSLTLVACGGGSGSSGGAGTATPTAVLNQWTWEGGSNTVDAAGVYGTLGTSASTNVPGARFGAVDWTDANGNRWLFGGFGHDSAGTRDYLNDLWKFSPTSNQWAWEGGSNTIDAAGVYGTLGTPAPGNIPGARRYAVDWTDARGNLWLFGGYGYDSTGTLGDLNDLWEFSPTSNQWTWEGGSSTVNTAGVYGTLGTPASTNVPGARVAAKNWTDANGNVWLFGGEAYGSDGLRRLINDLWKFNPATSQWTWEGGSSTGDATDVYGTLGTPAPGNIPGARGYYDTWTDASGTVWLFGGYGAASTGTQGELNELWTYRP